MYISVQRVYPPRVCTMCVKRCIFIDLQLYYRTTICYWLDTSRWVTACCDMTSARVLTCADVSTHSSRAQTRRSLTDVNQIIVGITLGSHDSPRGSDTIHWKVSMLSLIRVSLRDYWGSGESQFHASKGHVDSCEAVRSSCDTPPSEKNLTRAVRWQGPWVGPGRLTAADWSTSVWLWY